MDLALDKTCCCKFSGIYMKRRSTLVACAMLALAPWLDAGLAQAADSEYPNRPVRVLVPFPPGGAADVFARIMGEKLGVAMRQTFIVENRPGAGGILATETAARAAPDGHTLLLVTVGHAVNPSLYKTLGYDTLRDFAPVAMVATMPSVLSVNPKVPVTSLAELIAQAKAQPESITYGTAGNATTSHMAVAQLSSMAGVNLLHIPYKGAAAALTDVVGGHVQMIADPVVSSAPFIKSGELRPLAVTTAKRSPLLPDVPTMAEAGLPGYEFSAWFMVLAPTGTPAAVIDKLNAEIASIQDTPDVRQRYATLGAEPAKASPQEIGEFLRGEVARYEAVVRDNNITVQ